MLDDFLEMRKNMMSKVKKNKYPHRISRMGYANLAAELAKKMAEDKLTRRFMWKKARQDRNGNYRDLDTANKAAEIDKLDKEEDGSYCGPYDALTKALGNPEHRGRVRGVGGHVTPSTYFHQPKPTKRKSMDERIKASCKAMIDEAVAKEREYWVAKLGCNISPPAAPSPAAPSPAAPSPVTANSNCGSYTILPDNAVGVEENDEEVTVRAKKHLKLSDLNVEDVGVTGMQWEAEHVVEEDAPEMNEAPAQQPPPPPVKEKAVSNASVEVVQPQLKPSECRLALGSVDCIVAIGKLVGLQDNNIDNEKIHGVPMAEGNVRVTILRALVPDAELPFPVKDELLTVQDAVNSFVAWPKDMIVRSPPAAPNNKKPASKKYPEGRKTKKGKAAGSELELRINLKKLPKDYPGPLRCLWIWVTENLEDGKTLELKVTAPVFGIERIQRLYKSDMYAMCTMGLVSGGILIMYMCYLHEVLKKAKMLDMVAFVDTYQIAAQGCGDGETRARTLSARFATAKKGQLFIMPYNTG
ncbi:hypothetical protein OROGR_030985 [Orobanche gracilis]